MIVKVFSSDFNRNEDFFCGCLKYMAGFLGTESAVPSGEVGPAHQASAPGRR